MIGSCRLVLYGVAVTFSTLLSILSTYDRIDQDATNLIHRGEGFHGLMHNQLNSNINYHGQSDTNKINAPQLRRATPVKPVIAPWTKLIQKDGRSFPRSFVFSEVTRLSDYGLMPQAFDLDRHREVQKLLLDRLCKRSKKFATTKYDANKCDIGLELWKCSTCSELDGSWYVASSVTGSVFGKAEQDMSLSYPFYNDGPYIYQQLEIAVPISGQDEKLRLFALHLGSSIKKFREGLQGNRIAIRLLITRFQNEQFESEEAMQAFQNLLIKNAELDRPGDAVEFVAVDQASFSRAKAVNALHAVACHHNDCVLACTDVDMYITSKFLRNALVLPFPGAAAYFPIMWSEFNPETVDLADKFLTESAQWKFTDHHGYWRKSSFGMYVIAGSDAARLSMDEKFVGWGGEDNDFFARVGENLNIIRMHEKGLTHVWHEKDCQLGSFVENDFFKACVGAKAHTEGSQLGLYLRSLRSENKELFDAIMQVKSTKVDTLAQPLEEDNEDTESEKVSVLIAVITSRENLKTRVPTIMKTWGARELVPTGITIKFFVGCAESIGDSLSGSEEDIENLARDAGIEDISMIQVMKDVVDNEYPPVRKNSAMIRHLDEIVSTYENDATAASTFQWVYKVDDDAYVNLNGLLRFVKKRNPVGYHVYGERGNGRPEDLDGLEKGGLVKPYCTGGPGYIFSRPTLKRAAVGMDECVQEADISPYREYLWHSDVVIGMCVQKQTGTGCWSDDDYDKKRVFRNNFKNEEPFIKDAKLEWMVAMHPFKEEASMLKQHQRYIDMKSVAAPTR